MYVRFIAWQWRRPAVEGFAMILSIVLAGCQSSSFFKHSDNATTATGDGKAGAAGAVQGTPVPPTAGAVQGAPVAPAVGAVQGTPVAPTAGVAQGGPAPPVFRGATELAIAEDLYLQQDWKRAAKLFGKVADDKHNPPLYAEKARFFEAESQRLQGEYVDAMATFNRLLQDFQYGVYREQAVGRMYEIANFWLDDTRAQFEAEQLKAEGKKAKVHWNYVHFEKTKPLLDEEGHALKMLETVYFNDPTGPYADKALFAAGYVHFRRGDFRAADQVLTALIENVDKQGKKSEYRDRALELAILAKNNCSGGPFYDGRKAPESLKLIQQARLTSPELAVQRGDFLDNQAKMVRYMQAEKDYTIAEFYRRTGHPASAWFYYELVRRRYQGTEFHDKAVAHMKEINLDLTAQQHQLAIVKATRREWNKLAFGWEVPTLAANAPVPAVPGESTPQPSNPIVPVSGQR